MNKLLTTISLALGLVSGAALAGGTNCDAQATEKKLAGAAKTSFLKKCEVDAAAAACDAQAGEKKLARSAKNSYMTNCVADATK